MSTRHFGKIVAGPVEKHNAYAEVAIAMLGEDKTGMEPSFSGEKPSGGISKEGSTGDTETTSALPTTVKPEGFAETILEPSMLAENGGDDQESTENELGNPLHSKVPHDKSYVNNEVMDLNASESDSESTQIQAFAKLEFDDGDFFMNTWAVEFGRDIGAARAIEQHNREAKEAEQPHQRNTFSVVNEVGGIIRTKNRDLERRKKKRTSTSSSSRNLSRKNSVPFSSSSQQGFDSIAFASWTPKPVPGAPSVSTDPNGRLPPPDGVPVIGIHPRGSEGVRAISRKHAKIMYNFEKALFEVHVFGRNGVFVNEEFLDRGAVHELRSGDLLQIARVPVRFILPNTAIGETGAEAILHSDAVSASAMSYEFEDGRGESVTMRDSGEDSSTSLDEELDLDDGMIFDDNSESVQEILAKADSDEEENEGEAEKEDEELGDDEEAVVNPEQATKPNRRALSKPTPRLKKATKLSTSKSKSRTEQTTKALDNPAPKRKGPGRPPKNGIMSKKQQALLARDAKEAAKKAEASSKGKGKGKEIKKKHDDAQVKNIQPEAKPEKRKYTKRKKAKDTVAPEDQTAEGTGLPINTQDAEALSPEGQSQVTKPTKVANKRLLKPPRSPSPVYDPATLTPAQKAKPTQSYVVLIHEALTNHPTGQMSLPQIYRAIERRYPYYKVGVTTTGWQSSVRHNLSQHPAFQKLKRDGKGYTWGLVADVSIEKEKKRRLSPPVLTHQPYYQPEQAPFPYGASYTQPHLYPGAIPPPPVNRNLHDAPHVLQPPPTSGFPPGFNGLPLSLFSPNGTNATYQSPYQSTPRPSPAPTTVPQQPHPTQPNVDSTNPSNGNHTPANQGAPSQTTTNLQYLAASNTLPVGIPQPPESQPQPFAQSPQTTPLSVTITPTILTNIEKFKTHLLSELGPGNEATINAAVDRVIGRPSLETAGDVNEKQVESITPIIVSLVLKSVGVTGRDSRVVSTPTSMTATKQFPSPAPILAALSLDEHELPKGVKRPLEAIEADNGIAEDKTSGSQVNDDGKPLSKRIAT